MGAQARAITENSRVTDFQGRYQNHGIRKTDSGGAGRTGQATHL